MSESLDRWTCEREEYLSLLSSVKRQGMGDLMAWLENETDFFTAPASVNHHDAIAGGLLSHSLKVYRHLVKLSQVFAGDYDPESLIVIALLHDLCKVNFYSQVKKSLPRRDPKTGDIIPNKWGKPIWDECVVYEINDRFPIGHGEKSVILAQRFIPLTVTEIVGIRWHMMAYDDLKYSYGGNVAITRASEMFPIVTLVHLADLSASFLSLREGDHAAQ
ncbi:MAG: HD domain-containing protein [Candidatus Marinimicrobia bacterium]|nr:HD domain-containing protein [Candidatus Neomarinimicrobiota bacterium]